MSIIANDMSAGASGTSLPATDSSEPIAAMRLPGERFTCRVSIENFGLSVETAADATNWGTHLCWEELQVRCEYSGVVQKTRWMPLPLALEQSRRRQNDGSAVGLRDNDASASDADSSIRLDDDPTYGAGEHHTTLPAGATPNPSRKARAAKLDYSTFDNCSFEVEFTSGDESAAGDAAAMTAATRRVRRKRGHLMALAVETKNQKRLASTTGGDNKPTSASMEAINAAFQKGAAKLSAWARGTFSKKSAKKELEAKEREELEEEALLRRSGQTPMVVENTHTEGSYVPAVLPSIDFSEAFNAPGGRKRYHLILKPDRSQLPHNGEGVPLLVAFTVVAHYTVAAAVAPVRSFHAFAFVMDQFVLNASEALEVPMQSKRHGGDSSGVAEEVSRKVVGYGYAFTTNTAHSAVPMATSKIISLDVTRQVDGHMTRVIDFAAQHRTHDERQLTAADYEALPTTACIVSSDCLVANPERVGHRVLCVSRYKTSNEGLCKPSYKCQVTFTLMRQYDNGDVEQEISDAPVDLSAMLNQELFTSRDREVHFSLGEILCIRFRRFCFDEPDVHVAPLLLPFDYDNTGVVIRGVCGPVSSWTRRKPTVQPTHTQGTPASHPSDPGAATPYGANEVDEMPVNDNEVASATDSSSCAAPVDPKHPFHQNNKANAPSPAEEELQFVNPFAVSGADEGREATTAFTHGGTEGTAHNYPDSNALVAPAHDDFFMDDWGTKPPTQSTDGTTQDAVQFTGENMFATGNSAQGDGQTHAGAGNSGINMFATESRPAFVLEPMPGEEDAMDWTKWGQ